MEKLPNENIELIFHLLSLQSKIECMLVCQRWANILRSRCLLHTVNIVSIRVFKKFIIKVERKQVKQEQVERLILHDCIPSDYDTRKLVELFPRLRVLLMKPGIQLDKSHKFSSTLIPSVLSKHRLEHLLDFGRFELALQLVSQGLCPTLRTLELARPVMLDYGSIYIPFFKNIRFLTKLKMWDGHFTIQNLEDIHKSLPLLETLEISKMSQFMRDLPVNIVPATSVKTLTLNLRDDGSVQSKIKWLRYIRRKYPSLQHFTSHLNAVDHDDLYHEVESFLQQFGPQLKTIGSIEVPSQHNLLQTMDKFNCQIQDLSLIKFDNIASIDTSEQRKYIQNLSLYSSNPRSYQFLNSMLALKELEIYYYVPGRDPSDYATTITLDRVLACFPPTLESLTMTNVEIKFLGGLNFIESSLKSLTLSFCQIDDNLDEFVTKSLPKLDTLILERNKIIAESESLILPNHHLSYLAIDPVYPALYTNILVTTLNDRKSRLYYFDREVSFINNATSKDPYNLYYYETVKPIPFEDVHISYPVTIICGSIKVLVVDNKRAYQ